VAELTPARYWEPKELKTVERGSQLTATYPHCGEASEEDRAAFGDRTAAKQKEYLIRLAIRAQSEAKKSILTVKKRGIKAVTKVQPKRGVEGKAKK
jgi:hypothetical protein